jgi:hypothetical protein
MTAKQKLKMAEQQIAYWKAVAAEAKADLKEIGRRKVGKPARRALAYSDTRNGVTLRSAKPIKRGRGGWIKGEPMKGLTPAQRKLIPLKKSARKIKRAAKQR